MAKNDLEKICLIDRNNKLAEDKLNETLKNVARIKFSKQSKNNAKESN